MTSRRGTFRICNWLIAALALVAVGGCAAEKAQSDDHNPVWSVPVPVEWGLATTAAVAGDVVVVKTRNGIGVVAKSDGAMRWYASSGPDPNTKPNPAVSVIGDTLVAIVDGATRSELRGYDLHTGAVRYEQEVAGRSVHTAAGPVFTACTDRGACTIGRLDPATGATVWEQPIAARGRLYVADSPVHRYPLRNLDPTLPDLVDPLQPVPVPVVLHQVPAGTGTIGTAGAQPRETDPAVATRVTALDPADGRELSQWRAPEEGGALLSGNRFLFPKDASGCGTPAEAVDVTSGKRAWTVAAARWGSLGSPAECKESNAIDPAVDGTRALLMTESEEPLLVDVDRGAVTWKGGRGVHPLGFVGDLVVVRADRNKGDLAAINPADGRTVWSAQGGFNTIVGAGRVVFTKTGSVWVADPRTGTTIELADVGEPLGLGPDWLLTGPTPVSITGGKSALRLFSPI